MTGAARVTCPPPAIESQLLIVSHIESQLFPQVNYLLLKGALSPKVADTNDVYKAKHDVSEAHDVYKARYSWEGRCKATWKRKFNLPWREAGPPNHHNDEVDPDQKVTNEELSPLLKHYSISKSGRSAVHMMI